MMRVLATCLVLRGVVSFQVPTIGVGNRVCELRGLPIKKEQPDRRLRLPRLTLSNILNRFAAADFPVPPPGLHDTAVSLNLALLMLRVAGVDLGDAGNLATIGSFVFLASTTFGNWLQQPQNLVIAKLQKPYDPPPSTPWSGNITWGQQVLDLVEDNPLRKTLVLVDPSGNAKVDLLDDLFRDQVDVVAPAMKKLSLDEDISKYLDLKETKGLDAFVDVIKKGIKPDLGGMRVIPAKLIVDLLKVDDDAKISSVIRDVTLLKERAGDNVVSIITVANGTSIRTLPQTIRNALQVLS